MAARIGITHRRASLTGQIERYGELVWRLPCGGASTSVFPPQLVNISIRLCLKHVEPMCSVIWLHPNLVTVKCTRSWPTLR